MVMSAMMQSKKRRKEAELEQIALAQQEDRKVQALEL